jgi:hypothetical protein
VEEDRHRLGHQSRGAEEVGHWPGRRSQGVLGVEDAGGWASGGRNEGRRAGAGQGVGVWGVAVGAAEAGAQQPGWRPGSGGRAGGGRGTVGRWAVRVGGGRGVRVSVRWAGGGWQAHRSGAVATGTRVMAARI